MTLIQWTPAMSVGMTELDDDHKQLINVINHLAESAGDQSRAAVVRQCLMALRRYAERHFAREEKVLTVCDFPGLDVQRSEHRDFIDRVRKVTQQFDAEPEGAASVVGDELLNFVKNWLYHHILIEDMAYRPFVENNAEAKLAAKNFQATEIWWSR